MVAMNPNPVQLLAGFGKGVWGNKLDIRVMKRKTEGVEGFSSSESFLIDHYDPGTFVQLYLLHLHLELLSLTLRTVPFAHPSV